MGTQRIKMLALTASLLAPGAVDAGTLDPSSLVSVVGPGSATATAVTVAPNNYPGLAQDNSLTSAVTLTGVAPPIDLVLGGTNSGGSSEYFTTATFTNLTSTPLVGLMYELGTGTGANFQLFNFMPPVFFNFNSIGGAPSSDQFSQIFEAPEALLYRAGTQPIGSTSTQTFRLVVSDATSTPFAFTLREVALTTSAVPEPASAWMLAIGGTAILAARHHRRPRRN